VDTVQVAVEAVVIAVAVEAAEELVTNVLCVKRLAMVILIDISQMSLIDRRI
jgi:hypothetical protein